MAVCRHAEYFSGCLESLDGFVFHPRSRYGCRDGALSAGRTQVAIVFFLLPRRTTERLRGFA